MKIKIENFENYELYDNGDIINTNTNKKLNGKIRLNGYRVYTLSNNGKKAEYYAHRLVAQYFVDNDLPQEKIIVNHKDGNKLNNDYKNLEWVTQSENMAHAHNAGLIKSRREAEYYFSDLKNEIWKKYEDYDNYLISNYGRVRNVNTNRILKPSLTCGYLKIRLCKNGQTKDKLLHYLVYELFYSNEKIPNGYVIDHIDGDKQNNYFQNLRILSNKDNALAALYETKKNSSAKKVGQYDLNGNLLNTFLSTREAGRQLNLDNSSISKACRGVVKTCGGYKFKYL